MIFVISTCVFGQHGSIWVSENVEFAMDLAEILCDDVRGLSILGYGCSIAEFVFNKLEF